MTSSPIAPVVLWSKPAEQRAGTPLLVLLHGYGANEADLFGLAEQLPAEFMIAAVRAGQSAGSGFAWFPLQSDLIISIEAVTSAALELDEWLDSIAADFSSVTLLGFSQGMAMASTLARHRPERFAAVVGLSGFIIDAEADPYFKDAELEKEKLPFFWGRDQADPVLPQALIEQSNEWLAKHTKLTKVLYTGMWHGICQAEIGHVGEFLRAEVLNAQKSEPTDR
ncbi:COBF protein [Renibacterium salmoninarum ATCC 33209]|uniref:COBF protein n=1 Tax=Renibacterium salmoninarum (strain ATCC 33209 / DSM 20767 / JCM 11484 / NBRC 15589 / NCIMB 2235) TaxID=288705 RepID=A9WTY8_RENSM|nr:phospholipase [Renibacterium salmoninarum]ABY24659.1 COBF protein [Renibacterium salmoninarum ATCC 33209]